MTGRLLGYTTSADVVLSKGITGFSGVITQIHICRSLSVPRRTERWRAHTQVAGSNPGNLD